MDAKDRLALPPGGRRLRLAADLPQPAALPDRRPERRPAHAAVRRPGAASGSAPAARRGTARHARGRRTAATGAPARCPAASSSASAIAVALANDPAVVLADEPTGELDSATAEQVFAAFRTANEQLGTTVVIVTHDQAVADAVHRTVAISDGRTASEVVRRTEIDEHGRESVVAREYATWTAPAASSSPATTPRPWPSAAASLLELQPDHITVRPDDDRPSSRDEPAAAVNRRRQAGEKVSPAAGDSRRTATEPYGGTQPQPRAPPPAARRARRPSARRKPSAWAACTARTAAWCPDGAGPDLPAERVEFRPGPLLRGNSSVRARNSATASTARLRAPGPGRAPPPAASRRAAAAARPTAGR